MCKALNLIPIKERRKEGSKAGRKKRKKRKRGRGDERRKEKRKKRKRVYLARSQCIGGI
jgi:hypothetical protein